MSKRLKTTILNKAASQCRYMVPENITDIEERFVKYEYAKQLARNLKIGRNQKVSVIVNGSFIFGDFIEAFILRNRIKVKKMTLSTLSYNENNIDSLKTLMQKEWVDNLNIIVSDYFFGHERTNLIRYAYEQLDNGNNTFQLAIERTHCKIYMFETYNDSYFVIHGSVNLRSSGNSEQFTIEENKALYDFYNAHLSEILERNKTVNKSLKFRKTWQAVQKDTAAHTEVAAEQKQDRENLPQQNREVEKSNNGIQEWTRHFDEFDF
jgi:hypothetical protein